MLYLFTKYVQPSRHASVVLMTARRKSNDVLIIERTRANTKSLDTHSKEETEASRSLEVG
jgi:hypothetical protein